jgi:hypothetical protein
MKLRKIFFGFVGLGNPFHGLRFLWQFAALATTLLASQACAQNVQAPSPPVVDQSFNALEASRGTLWENTGAGIGLGIHSAAAQTFTVGRTGILTSVEVQIFRGTNSSQNITFEIRRTVNLFPSEKGSDLLAKKTIPLQNVPYARPAFVPVDLKDLCLNVHQGEVLAIVLKNKDVQGGCGWQTAPGDHYSGGKRFAKSRQAKDWISQETGLTGQDLGFITYVDQNYSCRPK